MTNGFFPYTFNGDEYDGFADDGFATEPDETATGTATGAEGGNGGGGGEHATDPQTALRRVVESYFYTGEVEAHHLDVFSREFEGFQFTAPPSFGASEMTSPIVQQGPDAQTVVVGLRELRRTARVPRTSVLPTRDTLGTTMRDFLDEVARAIPEFKGRKDRSALFKSNDRKGRSAPFKSNSNDREAIFDADDAPFESKDREAIFDEAIFDEDTDVVQKLVDVNRTWCSVPRFAPWNPRAKFTFDAKGRGAPFKSKEREAIFREAIFAQPPVDLTVRDDVFVEYIRAYRSNRTVGIMKDFYEHPDLVTLVLEAEADVWSACGGSSTRLPANVWITKRGAGIAADAFGRAAPFDETGAFEAFKKENETLFKGDSLSNVYVGDQSTVESQLYAACGDTERTKNIAKAFREWCEANGRSVALRLTDVLLFGGYGAANVAEAADALLTIAVRDGYVCGDGSNAMEQLLFRNVKKGASRPLNLKIAKIAKSTPRSLDLKSAKRSFAERSFAERPLSFVNRGGRVGIRVGRTSGPRSGSRFGVGAGAGAGAGAIVVEDEDEDGDEDESEAFGAGGGGEDAAQSVNASLDENAIVSAFRKGKERVLRDATREFGERVGGVGALIITDPDYRHHFITLCRANYQLKQVSLGASVVTDRRRRIVEQERLRRESLYFFQLKNGSATSISSRFL